LQDLTPQSCAGPMDMCSALFTGAVESPVEVPISADGSSRRGDPSAGLCSAVRQVDTRTAEICWCRDLEVEGTPGPKMFERKPKDTGRLRSPPADRSDALSIELTLRGEADR